MARYEPKRLAAPARPLPPEKKRGKRQSFWKDVVFYIVLAAFVLGVFLFKSAQGGAPTVALGWSAMRVLTGSMEEVIPQGSLILTKQVDPETLEIGDDITYMSGPETTVTHRIVAITENYQGTGERAFTTQGVMNASPDSQKVPAVNVVGKVVFHSLFLGKTMAFLQAYWMWIAILAALFAGLLKALKVVWEESAKEQKGGGAAPQTEERSK